MLNEFLVLQMVAVAIPAYVANAVPVIVAKILKKRTPIDMGKNFVDGRRILGDGKSIEGFIAGVLAGASTYYPAKVVFEALYLKYLSEIVFNSFFFIVTSIAALTGDMLGSFIKRRLGIPRGAPLPLVDQLSFIIIALIADYLIFKINIFSLEALLLVILTYAFHKLFNFLAFKLGLKNVPW
ncbi:MAG: CDP-2,3-bis-(O-geranylgeranyl)-sn-glycerol synthase [Thermoprotei archaeon]|nr:MAG: CDP-2,3-bis-(O-geranylgeranyl)-sn-glycerol synthase [Thermoprotei archaeon]